MFREGLLFLAFFCCFGLFFLCLACGAWVGWRAGGCGGCGELARGGGEGAKSLRTSGLRSNIRLEAAYRIGMT